MTAIKSYDVSETLCFRENNNDKEDSSENKDNKRAKTSEDKETEDPGSQQTRKVSCFDRNTGRFREESALS